MKNKIRTLLISFGFGVLITHTAPAQTNGPTLLMTSSNGVNTVFWPLTSYFDILQTTTNLSPSATWTNLVTGDMIVAINTYPVPALGGYASYTTDIIGNQLAFSLPPTNSQQFFRLKAPLLIPACSFAVFYEGVLEFSQCPPMIITGRVHANGSIYIGTSGSLTFLFPVTTTSNLAAPYMNGLTSGWTPSDTNTWNVAFNGNPGYITNVSRVTVWQNVTNYHFLIDVPPAGESPTSATGQPRYYNQAQMVLLVTNTVGGTNLNTLQVILQNSVSGQVPGNDPSPVYIYTTNASTAWLGANLPFLSLTNTAYDAREYATNLFTQIDVARFSSWIQTNSVVQGKLPASAGAYVSILYVADRRNNNNHQLSAVRLVNGAQLPSNNGFGFTVATLNPLYVVGDYNVQTASSAPGASAGTSNTSNTVPAALISDALTVLSSHWRDSVSFTSTYSTGNSLYAATATNTINAVIITGTVPSTGNSSTNFSGGFQNLARLLEDWSTPSAQLYINTSFIRLWNSQMATNQFRNPMEFTPAPVNPYYNPPFRRFSFDWNYLIPSKIPPGTPVFGALP